MAKPKKHGVFSAVMLGWRSMWQHPVLASAFLIATIAQGALQGLLVWALRYALLDLEGGDGVSVGALASGAAIILAIWILRSVMTFAGEVAQWRLVWRVAIDFTRRVIAKLLRFSIRYFERSSEGDLMIASWQDVTAVRTVTLQVGTMLLSISRLLGLAVAAWVLSPKLGLIGFVGVPIGLLPTYHLGRRIEKAARRQRVATVSLHDVFLQVASGIRVIKVNRGESRFLGWVRDVGKDIYRSVVRQRELKSLSRLLLEAVGGIGLIAVIIVGARDVALGTMEWQTLLSLLVAVIAIYAPVISLLGVYNQTVSTIPSLDRVAEILDAPSDIVESPHAKRLPTPPRKIELQDVTFAYDDALVLDSISATFQEGETIGIVGPSGAGKSTLIALMLRLYDPTRGRILYDGVDIQEIRRADLLDKCAIVLQEPFLFTDTVANNIRFTRPDASMDEVVAAAKAANLHEEIMLMEGGYDATLGGKDGRGISVGQKQRICIAAALLKNAPILFLDEATSNLDSLSERAVQDAIERLMEGRTTFIIAHRLSTLRAVDRILVLDGGRMVGLGSHDELLETCPTYRQPWWYQSSFRVT